MAPSYSRPGHRPDYALLAALFLLVIFGFVMLVSASSELGKKRFDDTYYYLKHQLLYGLVPGIAAFFIASKLHYRTYQKWAFTLLLLSLILLVLVFTNLGYQAGGAGRWLQIGGITFQPSEILKITFILYLAAWLANPRTARARSFAEGFLPFLLICGIVAGLLLVQPATSIVVILVGAGITVYFLSGAKIRYLFVTFLLGGLALALLVTATPYRRERFRTFFEGGGDELRAGYHVKEAITAIGSGGLLGAGFGESGAKSGRLPAAMTDSIFAIIASELGFVGAASLVALLGFLVIRILLIARRMRDNFGRYILVGFGMIIALQSFVHIAAMSGLIPLTGVPLPYVSYGGTAIVVFLGMAGIVMNISKYT